MPIDCIADNTRNIIDIHQYTRKHNAPLGATPDGTEDWQVAMFFGPGRIFADFDEKLQSWDDVITGKGRRTSWNKDKKLSAEHRKKNSPIHETR